MSDEEPVDGINRDGASTILFEDTAEINRALSASEALDNPLVGQVLDEKYRIDERLGQGGMGVVYKARHLLIDRPVAIKVLNIDLANLEDARNRFHTEVRLAGSLSHGNVVTVTDFGSTESNMLYVVMELLEGESLRSRLLRSKRFPCDEVVQMMLPIAKALAAAHDVGICHRDVKPENIFIAMRSHGEEVPAKPVLLDFGIAKRLDRSRDPFWTHTTRDSGSAAPFYGILDKAKKQISRILNVGREADRETAREPAIPTTRGFKVDREAATLPADNFAFFVTPDEVIEESLTRTGTIMGTPLYMSPEQLRGQPIDYRTDIYSFSAVVYEMLSGSTPIVATTKDSFVSQLLYDEPSPFPIELGVPPALENSVRRGLAKNRDERQQNMSEVIEELQLAI